jgi:hypothetical protein
VLVIFGALLAIWHSWNGDTRADWRCERERGRNAAGDIAASEPRFTSQPTIR